MHPYSYANTYTHIIFPKPTLLFVIPKNTHTHTHIAPLHPSPATPLATSANTERGTNLVTRPIW